MVSHDIKQLQLAFAASFKARGFRKDGPTWRRAFSDAIVVFGPDHFRNFFYDVLPQFCIGIEKEQALATMPRHLVRCRVQAILAVTS